MSKSLFETLGRRASLDRQRREWVAQGLFVYAVESNPDVRGRLKAVLDISSNSIPVAKEEVAQEYWRSDVSLIWGAKTVNVELKLGASLTPGQKKALDEGKIDLLIAPRRWLKKHSSALNKRAKPPKSMSWTDLADVTLQSNLPLHYLLKQAEEAEGSIDTLALEDAKADFRAFVGKEFKNRSYSIIDFLTALDQMLSESHAGTYVSEQGWSRSSNESEPYIGYCFRWGPSARKRKHYSYPYYWIGFCRSQRAINLQLWKYDEGMPEERVPMRLGSQSKFEAAAIAEHIGRLPLVE